MNDTQWTFPAIDNAWFLTGPTAGGKTEVGIRLAERLDGEVLSLDSMAVYQSMNIGTAKPTHEQQQRIPHHLLDLVPPTESFSLSSYVRLAHEKAAELSARRKTPIFVGGTPLYLKSLLRGMYAGPAADEDFRKEIEREVELVGIQELYKRVQQVDPLSAHRIMPTDLRRLTRALEVYRVTGKPLSHWQVQFDRAQRKSTSRAYVLMWDRSQIHTRVNARVDQMIDEGLFDEVQTLQSSYGTLSRTAAQAVGYKESIAMLAGELSKTEAIEQIKAHTRQFVRRQDIWFRSLTELNPVSTSPDRLKKVDEIVTEILEARPAA